MAGSKPVSKKDEKVPRLGGALDFLRHVWAVDHELQSASKTLARRTGLTERQRLVLKLLGKQGGGSPSELATSLHLHPSTMTGIVQRLVRDGHVARGKHGEDARKEALSLTDKGRAALEVKGGPSYEQAVRKALGRFDDTSVETARQVLAAIAEELAARPADARPPRGGSSTRATPALAAPTARPVKAGASKAAKPASPRSRK
jgi:DNA-binding MarR family transcriptional regulator